MLPIKACVRELYQFWFVLSLQWFMNGLYAWLFCHEHLLIQRSAMELILGIIPQLRLPCMPLKVFQVEKSFSCSELWKCSLRCMYYFSNNRFAWWFESSSAVMLVTAFHNLAAAAFWSVVFSQYFLERITLLIEKLKDRATIHRPHFCLRNARLTDDWEHFCNLLIVKSMRYFLHVRLQSLFWDHCALDHKLGWFASLGIDEISSRLDSTLFYSRCLPRRLLCFLSSAELLFQYLPYRFMQWQKPIFPTAALNFLFQSPSAKTLSQVLSLSISTGAEGWCFQSSEFFKNFHHSILGSSNISI